jgi:hypothetical protein
MLNKMIALVEATSLDAYPDIVGWSEVIRASNLDRILARVSSCSVISRRQEMSEPAIRVVIW